jgi:hypothetical protein
MFVPIPTRWLFQEPMISGFAGGSNGNSPKSQERGETTRWQVRDRNRREADALPNQLLWTWFVDNSRPPLN